MSALLPDAVTNSVPTIHPSDAQPIESEKVLSEEQVRQWREEGCVVVNGVFPADVLDRVNKAALKVYPDGNGPMVDDFGSGGKLCFPVVEDGLTCVNEIPLHIRMINAIAQLMGCSGEDLRLCQSDLWGKRGHSADATVFGPTCNADQRIHCDYPNHTLVVPPSWESPEVVAAIVYFDDSAVKGGQTRVVPRQNGDDPAYKIGTGIGWGDYGADTLMEGANPILLTPGARGDMLWINDRTHAETNLQENRPDVHKFRQEHLYPREQKVGYQFGTVLFYRHDVWHRGTPLFPGATRRTHNLVYKKAGCDWVNHWNTGIARRMYEQNQCIERIIAQSCTLQRAVLGFPAPSSAYWTQSTLAAVKLRYSSVPGGFLHTEDIEAALRNRAAEK